MRRRWFYRVTSLTLLIRCLAAWGWSYLYVETIWHTSPSGAIGVTLETGGIHVSHLKIGLAWDKPRWVHYRRPNDSRPEWSADSDYRFMGLAFFNEPGWGGGDLSRLRVPCWFPTLLLAALTGWTWRKRRSKGDRGFAVEQTPAA